MHSDHEAPPHLATPALWLDRLALAGARRAIDQIDDRMVALFAHRQHLAALAGRIKAHAGLRSRDGAREQAVITRAREHARRRGLDPDGAGLLMSLLIAQAHRRQRTPDSQDVPSKADRMSPADSSPALDAVLGALPPPRYWRPWLAHVPARWQQALVPRLLAQAIAQPEVWRSLQPVAGRRIGIQVTDLDLHWVITLAGERLISSQEPAEATVSGEAADLLLLASRLEDADTLFFQRRLTLTGDTELGLLLRNLLDRLPWESIPLAQRILLQRGARLLQRARAAHRARQVTA